MEIKQQKPYDKTVRCTAYSDMISIFPPQRSDRSAVMAETGASGSGVGTITPVYSFADRQARCHCVSQNEDGRLLRIQKAKSGRSGR